MTNEAAKELDKALEAVISSIEQEGGETIGN